MKTLCYLTSLKQSVFQQQLSKMSRGATPSYVWRGIWEAKSLLLQGCRWRVGDGKAINVWTDYQLPHHKLVPVSESVSQAQLNWTVFDLIDDHTNRWDMKKISRLLPLRVAYEVFKLPLPANNRPDTIVWEPEKHGLFIVRSAYRLFIASKEERQMGEVSYREEQKKLWRKIWKLQVPNRVRIFAWRIC